MPCLLHVVLTVTVVLTVFSPVTLAADQPTATTADQALEAAGRYTGLVSSMSADPKQASVSEAPFSSVGDLPIPLQRQDKAGLLWLVRCDSVPLAWRASLSDSIPTYSYHPVDVYLDHQSLSFIKAVIRSPQPCPLAPEDWYFGDRVLYETLEDTLEYSIAPVEPDSAAPLSKAILMTQAADPSTACEIEAYSASFVWKGGKRPVPSPPDSTPCWGIVYKYYTPEYAVDSAHRVGPESGPPIKIISVTGSFLDGQPGRRVIKTWPTWMLTRSRYGPPHPKEL